MLLWLLKAAFVKTGPGTRRAGGVLMVDLPIARACNDQGSDDNGGAHWFSYRPVVAVGSKLPEFFVKALGGGGRGKRRHSFVGTHR